MSQLQNLEKLNSNVRKIVEPYVEKLIELHDGNLVSIAIYGSAVGKDFIQNVSDINVVVILEKADFEDMKKSLELVAKGLKNKIRAPLFLSRDYLSRSVDVFPIEFFEIKENHIVVFGQDIFNSLNISHDNLRLFCEQQIKGKWVRINQAYLEIGLKNKAIERLLKDSLHQLFPVFRNILRLKGIKPDVAKIDIIDQVCREFQLDADIFIAIVRSKKYNQRIDPAAMESHLKKFLYQIEKLAVHIDRL